MKKKTKPEIKLAKGSRATATKVAAKKTTVKVSNAKAGSSAKISNSNKPVKKNATAMNSGKANINAAEKVAPVKNVSKGCCDNSTTTFNKKYPTVSNLRSLAQKNIPKFCFEYLDGGCNEDRNLHLNTSELRQVTLQPHYLKRKSTFKNKSDGLADISATLFGKKYAAPFGVSPMGLQGLMWPKASQILAKAATRHNLPFILSTLTTMDLEEAGKLTDGNLWFQLYNPTEDRIRDDLLARAKNADAKVLVVISDVPMHGYRPRDIRNGLAMPPSMSLSNIYQMAKRPKWVLKTLAAGTPQFKTLLSYMPKGLDLRELGKYMNTSFDGRLSQDNLKSLRDKWKGQLVVKGLATEEDCSIAHKIGVDGVIISNHGGRQLDLGESSIKPMARIVKKFKNKMPIMIDSGVREGTDIAAAMALGSSFVFLGRSCMYSVAALGNEGGNHLFAMLKEQLFQIMEQVRCEKLADLPNHLYK